MSNHKTTRHCGHCGQPVGTGAVTCPHCDALLAAYEAPSGSTEGTTDAVTPVPVVGEPPAPVEKVSIPDPPEPITTSVRESSEPAEPYESLTGKSLSSLRDERPEIDTTSSPFGAADSPVTQALKETRIDADLDDRDDDDEPPLPSEQAIDIDEAREALGLTTGTEEPTGSAQSDDAEIDRITARAMGNTPAGHSAEKRTRRVQTERVARRTQPGITSTPPAQQADDEPSRESSPSPDQPESSGVSIPMFIGMLVVFAIFIRIVGTGSFSGFLIIPIIILGLLWFMSTVVKNSGRKTTTMPRDKNRRR